MLQAILQSFHLTAKEIRIIERCLELGPQPASSIARVAEMPRNTVRHILDQLVKKGLMVKTKRANTQYYAVEKRDKILRSLKLQKVRYTEDIDHQIELIEQYGDELNARHHAKSRPKITFYEGTSGLEKVYEDTLTAKEDILSWANFDEMHDAMPEYFETYYKRRAKKKIYIHSIHPNSALAKEKQKHDKDHMRESMLVDPDLYTWDPEIQVYNNKVNITSWKEKLGIIIESEEIAQAMKAMFAMCKKAAKKGIL